MKNIIVCEDFGDYTRFLGEDEKKKVTAIYFTDNNSLIAQVVIGVVIKPRKVINCTHTYHRTTTSFYNVIRIYYSHDGRRAITPKMGIRKNHLIIIYSSRWTNQQRTFCDARTTVTSYTLIWQSNLLGMILSFFSIFFYVFILYLCDLSERSLMVHAQM